MKVTVAPGQVLLDAQRMVEKTDKGILLALESQIPQQLCRVVAAGKPKYGTVQLHEKDWVYLSIHPGSIDGLNSRILRVKDHPYLFTNELYLSFKFRKHMEESIRKYLLFPDKNPIILDYATDVEVLGRKAVLRILKPEEKTRSGILLPDFKMGKDKLVEAEILALGPDANEVFTKPTLFPGQRVMVSQPSGGELPFTPKGELIWRTNGHEILVYFDETQNQWVPIGGRVIVKPLLDGFTAKKITVPHQYIAGATHEIEVYESEANSNIVFPHFSVIPHLQAKVVAVGNGWSEKYSVAVSMGDVGKANVKPGDIVLHTRTVNHQGEQQRGVVSVEIGGEKLLMMPNHILDGKVKERLKLQPLATPEISAPAPPRSSFNLPELRKR